MKVPEIRFKGFDDEWQETLLSDWLIPSKKKNTDLSFGKNDVLSVSSEFGVVNQIQFQGKSFAGASVANYGVLNKGDIVYTKSPLRQQPYGIIKSNKDRAGIVSTLYATYNCCDNVCPDFVEEYFNNDNRLNKYLRPLVRKGAKNDMKISSEGALEGNIIFPLSKDEQILITEFLAKYSLLINFCREKIDRLQKMKNSMLANMFPQKGETKPKVRFKGFEGDWNISKISTLYERSSLKNDLSFDSNKIISVANMYFIAKQENADEEYLKTYNIMHLGDIAFEGNKSKNFSHGRFVENTIGDGIISHVFVVFKPLMKNFDLLFWKYYINNENIMKDILVRCTKSSTMMTDLVVEDFLKESLLVPSYEEQMKIGDYFRKLDEQINLETKRLEKLKRIKSACLDKMFV